MARRNKLTKKPNVSFVTDMMNFSHYGVLKQAFILEAIREYAKRHAENEETWDNGLIHSDTWKGIAKEVCDDFTEWLNPGLSEPDRKSTRLNSSHIPLSRMPSSA